jgi:glutaredoxin
MKKLILSLGFALGVLGGFSAPTQAQKLPVLEFYHGATCPHCHEEKEWFDELKTQYPDIEIKEFEVWFDADNQKKWAKRMADLGQEPQGVPTNIIEDQVIVGFRPNEILAALEKSYGPPIAPKAEDNKAPPTTDKKEWEKYLQFSWPVMSFLLGAIDGFNPCAMWSLIVLIGFLLTLEDKRKRWLIGGVFLASSAILYFGALLTYLLGFTQIVGWLSGGAMLWTFRAVGILAIFTGGMALWKFRENNTECDVRDAKAKKTFHEKLNNLLSQEKLSLILPGIIVLAFSVNAIELLCSFAIPTAFTATLVSGDLSFFQQLLAISIYDVAYILDDLIVFFIAMWTLNLKLVSHQAVRWSHFAGGLILLLIGATLLLNPSLLGSWFS